jgi:DNA repair protein RadA/Sms
VLSVSPPSVRDMSKTLRPSYLCSECGWTSAKWVGRCGECQAWGSVAEAAAPRQVRAEAGPVSGAAVPIAQVSGES